MPARDLGDLGRRVLESAPVMILVLSPEGRILFVNPYFTSVTGYALGEIRDQDWFTSFLPERERTPTRQRFDGALHGVPTRAHVSPIVTRSGVERQIEWNDQTQCDAQGNCIGLLCLGQDVTERRSVEESLRRTRDQLDATLHALPDLLFEVDADGVLHDYHANRPELLLVPPEQFLGRRMCDVLPTEVADAGMSALAEASRHGHALGPTYRLQVAEGERWFEPSVARKSHTEGQAERFILLARDVTDRVQAERAQRANEAQLRVIADNLPVSFCYVDHEERYRFVNRLHAEMLGHVPQAVLGTTVREVIGEEVYRIFQPKIQRALNGERVSYVETYELAQGGRVSYGVDLVPDAAPDGTVRGYFSLVIDVTERERAADAIVASEQRLRVMLGRMNEAQRIAQVGSWELDLRGNTLTWSDEIFRIFELDPEQFGASYEAFLAAVHPDDRIAVNEAYTSSVATGKPYEITHRLQLADGRIKFVQERCETHYDPQGEPLRSVGTVQDITERTLTGAALQREVLERAKAQAASTVLREQLEATLQAIPDLLFELDEEGRYLAVHTRQPDLLVATPERLLGCNVREALNPDAAECVMAALHEAAHTGVSFGRSYQLTLPSGERWFELSVARKGVKSGRAPTFVALSREITARVLAEQSLKASLEQKSLLLREVHHRVKNNLQVISSLLHLQMRRSSDPSVLALFEESRARVRAMAMVHELLCESQDLGNVDFAEYLRNVTRGLFGVVDRKLTGLQLSVEAEQAFLDIQLAVPCGLIVNELMTNVLKYAFPQGRAGQVRVWFRREPERRCILGVADDGVGLPDSVDPHSVPTLGLHLVRVLAQQIDAVMHVERSRGTLFELRFRG